MAERAGEGRHCTGLFSRRLVVLVVFVCLWHLAGCGGTQARPTAPKRSQPVSARFSPGTTWYRVKKGDTLYAVSWRAGLDYRTLARWNALKYPYTIYPGQLLRLKPPRKPPRKQAKSASRGKVKKNVPRHSPSRSTTAARQKKGTPSTASAKPRTPGHAQPSARRGRLHWQWPVKGRVVSRFSHQAPDLDGIKIAGTRGQKVVAAESGTVVYTGSGLIGYGQLIIVKHNNAFLSAYGLNSRLYVKEGQRVKRGQHISDMGTNSAGKPMLHFEIRRYGKPVDPLAYLPRN